MKTHRPLNDFVLVKRQEAEKKTDGGIIIPDGRQVKSRYGEVRAVGPGKFLKDSTERRTIDVSVGDVVYFRGTSGQEIDIEGESGYVFLRESEIEGTVEKATPPSA